jgi:hypothetical protein
MTCTTSRVIAAGRIVVKRIIPIGRVIGASRDAVELAFARRRVFLPEDGIRNGGKTAKGSPEN